MTAIVGERLTSFPRAMSVLMDGSNTFDDAKLKDIPLIIFIVICELKN